ESRRATQRGHKAVRSDAPNSLVIRIIHKEISRAVHGQSSWSRQSSRSRGPIRTSNVPGYTSERGHYASGRYLPDNVIKRIANVNVSCVINCDAFRIPEPG